MTEPVIAIRELQGFYGESHVLHGVDLDVAAGEVVTIIGRISDLIRIAAKGRTVLMVEHNLSVVASLADRITVLARGRVLAEGDYRSISADQRVIEAYLGGGGHGHA